MWCHYWINSYEHFAIDLFIGDVIGIDWYENASLEITTDDGRIECFKGNYIVKDHKGKIKVHEVNEFETTYREVENYD